MKKVKARCEESSQGYVALDQLSENNGLGEGGHCGGGDKRKALQHISDVSVAELNNGLVIGLKERKRRSQGVWAKSLN